jgi:hypothetical protein
MIREALCDQHRRQIHVARSPVQVCVGKTPRDLLVEIIKLAGLYLKLTILFA